MCDVCACTVCWHDIVAESSVYVCIYSKHNELTPSTIMSVAMLSSHSISWHRQRRQHCRCRCRYCHRRRRRPWSHSLKQCNNIPIEQICTHTHTSCCLMAEKKSRAHWINKFVFNFMHILVT